MSFQKFFSKLKREKQPEKGFFLAVEISSETVKSALWTVQEGKTKIIKFGSLQDWDGQNQELLLTAADVSISKATEASIVEPGGVIFGLPRDWVEKEKIKEEKKELLKYICQKLELKPLGFVVVLESLAAYLKAKEGTPLNAVLIKIQETESLISLVKTGKLRGTKIVGRSQDLAADVKEGLARFNQGEELPARMILFDGPADFEEYKQQLISFEWQEELPFLHFPKVESLETNKSIEAVALAGGAEVAKSLGFEIKEKEEGLEKEEAKEEAEAKKTKLQGKPLVVKEELIEPPKKEDKIPEKTSTLEELGFVEEGDITQVQSKPSFSQKNEEMEKEQKPRQKKGKAVFKNLLVSLRFSLIPGRVSLVIFSALIIFLILVGAGLAGYWYLPRAKVTIYLKPRVLEKRLELVIDSSAERADYEEGVIPGQRKELEVEETRTTEATGKKIVGEEAKGEVTIYNKTEVAKLFSKGAVLVGPGELLFALDEDVQVASRSAEEEGITYGREKTMVTALSIGTESNLEAETQLNFQEYSDSLYSAKTESGFSGGTSREIRVVSAQDRELLLENLKEDLRNRAEADLKKDLTDQERGLTEGMEEETLAADFSAEEGEETDSLQLKLKMNFFPFVCQKTALEEFFIRTVKESIPSDFVFDPQEATIEIEETRIDEGRAEIVLTGKSYLLPRLDFSEIKKNLTGRYPQATEDYLESLTNFSRAEIEITPKLPEKIRTLPRLTKNIILETEVEE